MAADHASHLGWDEWERSGAESPLAQVYGILDEAVGALTGALGGDFMIVSDHGSGPLHGVVNLNAWLAGQGLLEYAGAAELMRGGQLQRMAAARALALWRRLPLDVRTRVKQRLGRLRERSYELQNYSVVDFERTKAFAYGTFGNIVDQRARARAASASSRPAPSTRPCATRSRRPCASCATPPRGARSWPRCTGARSSSPDLTSTASPTSWSSSSTTSGSARATSRAAPRRSGTASRSRAPTPPTSAATATRASSRCPGPSAAPGGLFASIEDVAPTIQYLLGEPIPEGMEGQLIDAAIDPALLERRPPVYAADDVELSAGVRAFEDNEAGDVQERLRGLGYIE